MFYYYTTVSAAFAETVKASEPITTVAIGLIFLKETVSMRTYSTLIPICCGVALSCYHDESFNTLGFLLAAGSNVCFSSRAVLAKKLNILYPEGIDDITMFSLISTQGLMFLVPITIFVEGQKLMGIINGSSLYQSEFNRQYVFFALIINGIMFAIYNLVSYLVLRRSDLITHSVLNAFRRVFIIVFTTYFFKTPLTLFNMIGVGIAIVGVLCFGYSKSLDKPKSES